MANEGRISRWKMRQSNNFLGMCGEKLSADLAEAAECLKEFEKVIADNSLSLQQNRSTTSIKQG